jgi:hypothetical protein
MRRRAVAQETTYRDQRALTSAELTSIAAAINAASSGLEIVGAVVTAVFTVLLGTLGESLEDYGPDRMLVPSSFAIPATQWAAIAEIAVARAAGFGGRMSIALELVNVMPTTYDDPSAPVPEKNPADQRPYEHVLTVSREAADVIAAASRHCAALASYFGTGSRCRVMAGPALAGVLDGFRIADADQPRRGPVAASQHGERPGLRDLLPPDAAPLRARRVLGAH